MLHRRRKKYHIERQEYIWEKMADRVSKYIYIYLYIFKNISTIYNSDGQLETRAKRGSGIILAWVLQKPAGIEGPWSGRSATSMACQNYFVLPVPACPKQVINNSKQNLQMEGVKTGKELGPTIFYILPALYRKQRTKKTKNSKNKLNHFLSGHVGSVLAVRFGSRFAETL